ncbi:MAG: tryptophan synthase subunit alpha, partial [Gammaproteobacteria bacterium]
MSRIASTFDDLKRTGRKALIPFITAGDPRPAATVGLMRALVGAGADVIELGVPFSDPMADGPAIQRASERALRQGTTLSAVLDIVREFRSGNSSTPVVLMGYANPIEAMGFERFADAARDAGVDGVLVVDYPPEESAPFAAELEKRGIDTIFLLAPTTTDARVSEVAKHARGYIYYVSLKGVTGASNLDVNDVSARISNLRSQIRLPIGVGFGIRDAQTAKSVAAIADAVVIGTRLVQEIEDAPA